MKRIKFFSLLLVLFVSFTGSLFAQKDQQSAQSQKSAPLVKPGKCPAVVEKAKMALQLRADQECRSLTQCVECLDEKGSQVCMPIAAHPGKNCPTSAVVSDVPAADGKRVPPPFDVEILQSVCYREGVTLEAFLPNESAARVMLQPVKPTDGKIDNRPYVPSGDYSFQWTIDGKKMGTESRLECITGKEARLDVTQNSTKIMVSKAIKLMSNGGGPPDAKMKVPTTTAPTPTSNLVASFSKTSCFGNCPAFEVKFYGDGQVEWNGLANVSKLGKHRATIGTDKFLTMNEKATALKFWDLKSHYPEEGVIMDAPSTIIYLKVGGHEKQVENVVGAPQGFLDLEKFFDTLVDSLSFNKAGPTKTTGTIAPVKD